MQQYWQKVFDILFYPISLKNLGQMSKPETVLESWECVDFKTVPDFAAWQRFDGEIVE